ncbi:MAG: FHA domain-containing protein [Candidatus Eiseniibacteriota bacterium]
MRTQGFWRFGTAALLIALLAAAARAEIGHDPATAGLNRPLDMVIGAAALLALIAVMFALRRTRLAMLQAVARLAASLRGSAPEIEPEPGDWLLTGIDRRGAPIRLVVSLRRLGRDDQGLVIGRNRRIADLLLSDPGVSRRHARVVASGDGIALIDLKSKRGTWVGGTRLAPYAKPTAVEAGSMLRFGPVTLEARRA